MQHSLIPIIFLHVSLPSWGCRCFVFNFNWRHNLLRFWKYPKFTPTDWFHQIFVLRVKTEDDIRTTGFVKLTLPEPLTTWQFRRKTNKPVGGDSRRYSQNLDKLFFFSTPQKWEKWNVNYLTGFSFSVNPIFFPKYSNLFKCLCNSCLTCSLVTLSLLGSYVLVRCYLVMSSLFSLLFIWSSCSPCV